MILLVNVYILLYPLHEAMRREKNTIIIIIYNYITIFFDLHLCFTKFFFISYGCILENTFCNIINFMNVRSGVAMLICIHKHLNTFVTTHSLCNRLVIS